MLIQPAVPLQCINEHDEALDTDVRQTCSCGSNECPICVNDTLEVEINDEEPDTDVVDYVGAANDYYDYLIDR